jgi:hypothetical protein
MPKLRLSAYRNPLRRVNWPWERFRGTVPWPLSLRVDVSPLKSAKSGADWPVTLANPWLKRILGEAHRVIVGLTPQLLRLLQADALLDSDSGIGQLLECARPQELAVAETLNCHPAHLRKSEIPHQFLISNQLVTLVRRQSPRFTMEICYLLSDVKSQTRRTGYLR